MVTKGLIKKINYLENNCSVRLPLFETAGQSSEVCITATFAIQPGTINSYKENDVVIVAFENNSINSPIVIGKLYLGASTEGKDYRGAIKCESLAVATEASLPITTKLDFGGDIQNVANVQGGVTNYKSILDIVKALQQAEDNINYSSKELLSLDAQISEIKISYLETNQRDDIPTAEDERWQDGMPTWKDGWFIWQKTTYYNRHGQILGTPEIICLSTISTVASYWINCSSRIHTGTKQTSNIKVTAMAKLGNDLNTTDSNAFLNYKWTSDKSWSTTKGSTTPYELAITPDKCKDEDLIVEAWRSTDTAAYDSETITFAPKDTPVLDLDNDSAAIAYDSRGTTKLNWDDSVTSTAAVYFNGQKVEENIEFTWKLTNCKIKDNDKDEFKTNPIVIYEISDTAEAATAECSATYKGATLKKTFTITKAKQGNSPYKIDITNDFVSINTGSDGVINTSYDWSNTTHKINIYYGEKLETKTINIEDSSFTPTKDTGLCLKYTPTNVTVTTIKTDNGKIDNPFEVSLTSLGDSGDVGQIIYQLFDGVIILASAKFEINRIRNGEAACMYRAHASSETIAWSGGNPTPSSIEVYLEKIEGNTTQRVASYIRYKVGNGTWQNDGSIDKDTTDKTKNYTKTSWGMGGVTSSLVLEFYLNDDDRKSVTNMVDRITITAIKDGGSSEIQQAFLWANSYTYVPDAAPTGDVTKTEWSEAGEWALIPTEKLTKEKLNNNTPDWKLIFISTRTKNVSSEGVSSNSNWSAPEVYLCRDEKAYRILTTSEGLFGYESEKQGVFYTVNTTTTFNNKTFTAGSPYTPEELAEYAAASANNRKNINLYINAEYIKTGAFTVGDKSNPLFQAGLDTGTNGEAVVKIAGFDITTNKISKGTLGNANSISMSPTGLSGSINNESKDNWGLTLGSNFGVDLNGNLKAATGQLGSWSLTNDWLGVGTVGQDGSIFLFPNGYDTSIGGESKSNWGLTLGSNFGVDTTGSMLAKSGKIGDFNLTNNSLYSNEYISNFVDIPTEDQSSGILISPEGFKVGRELVISASGELIAENCKLSSGNIGNWELSPSGLSSETIQLLTNQIKIGRSSIYSSGDKLIINGGHLKSGFIVGFEGATYTETTLTFNLKKKNGGNDDNWILKVSLDNPLKETRTFNVYIVGRVGAFLALTTHLVSVTIQENSTEPIEIDLTSAYGFNEHRGCDISFSSSSLDTNYCTDKHQTRNTYITKKVSNYSSGGGLNESYGTIVPHKTIASQTLNLGSADSPWDALYVRQIRIPEGSETTWFSTFEDNTTDDVPDHNYTPPADCFDAGTKITMADGSYKNIEEINKDDLVQSYNVYTNTVETAKVLKVHKRNCTTNLVLLTFSDETKLWTTTSHPFYTTSGWVSLTPTLDYALYEDISDQYFEMMTIGQQFYKFNLKTNNIDIITLNRIQYRHGVESDHYIYNIDVDNSNTFFTNGILSHNKGYNKDDFEQSMGNP